MQEHQFQRRFMAAMAARERRLARGEAPLLAIKAPATVKAMPAAI